MKIIDSKILKTLRITPVVILGEMHGAKVNPALITFFVNKIKPDVVFFEWPEKWQNVIDRGTKKQISESFKLLKDGRALRGHLALILKLRKSSISIIAIDSGALSWNNRDREMYRKVQNIIGNKNLRCLIIVGNLHARKTNFVWKSTNQKYVPLGSYFRKTSKNILLRYADAKINNFGIVKIHDSIAKKKLEQNKDGILKSGSKFFDYEHIVKYSGPGELVV